MGIKSRHITIFTGALAALILFTMSGLVSKPHAMTLTGRTVDKIKLMGGPNTWEALDEKRLVLSLNDEQNYLLILSHSCHVLPFASLLGVSTSDNTVYAGFDYVTADGMRCAIQTIHRLSTKQKENLTRL